MGDMMFFITVGRWRKKPTKEMVDQASKLLEQMGKEGIKRVGNYWTLGRYDIVAIFEAKDEKALMKAAIRFGDMFSLETLVAVPREEAVKLIE